jgi:hypothetical protein
MAVCYNDKYHYNMPSINKPLINLKGMQAAKLIISFASIIYQS